jgi:hypothetical protein
MSNLSSCFEYMFIHLFLFICMQIGLPGFEVGFSIFLFLFSERQFDQPSGQGRPVLG